MIHRQNLTSFQYLCRAETYLCNQRFLLENDFFVAHQSPFYQLTFTQPDEYGREGNKYNWVVTVSNIVMYNFNRRVLRMDVVWISFIRVDSTDVLQCVISGALICILVTQPTNC